MTEDRKRAFIKKLGVLLSEYDVSICASVGDASDTHGIFDESISILHKPDKESFIEETWFKVSGWCIGKDELS